MRGGRNRLAGPRVEHDDVGIGPDGNRALLRVDIQNLRDVGRGDCDKFVHRDPARGHAMRPQQRKPILKPACAVRDLGEITPAHLLLLGGKGAMVGGHHRQRSSSKARPKTVLVALVAEGGRHDPLRRIIPVGVGIFTLVQQQMLYQRFAPDPRARLFPSADRLVRLFR